MTLERAGLPAVVVTTTAFETLARKEAYALGMEALPLLVVEHPLGGQGPEGVTRRAEQALAQLLARLGR